MRFLIGAGIAALILFPLFSAAQAPALPPECVAVSQTEAKCEVAVPSAGPGTQKVVTVTVTDAAGKTFTETITTRVSSVVAPQYDGSTLKFNLVNPGGIAGIVITVPTTATTP